ncbi:MAG: hypothetical protein K2K97_04130 [Muribaculaceae bacterium]|nr:hypothetical protein [Muribaculaceae bacterium]
MVGEAIAEIFFTIYDRWSARTKIKEKTKENNSSINKLVVFANQTDAYNDEEEFVIRAYDKNNNHIANINVTTPTGTGIRVGETLYA